MQIAIVGGRDFNDYESMKRVIDAYFPEYEEDGYYYRPFDGIVSGGAKGADSLAKRFALENKFTFIEYLPNWEQFGKSAGPIRNQQIVDAADIIIAFWDGKSRGTKDTINKAMEAKKHILIIPF